MKMVQRSVCPECGQEMLALITFDASGRRTAAQCRECHHTWPLSAATSEQPVREDA